MDFQTHARTHAATLVHRLLAKQASASHDALRAVQEALEAAMRQLEAPGDVEADLADFVQRLSGAAEERVRAVRDEAEAAIEAARGEAREREAEIDAMRRSIEQAEADAAERDQEVRRAQDALAAMERELVDARAAIELMLAETEQLRAECARVTALCGALEAQIAQARAAAADRDALASELEAARERMKALDSATEQVRALEAQVQHAHAAAAGRETLLSELEAARERVKALEYATEQVRTLEAEVEHARAAAAERDALVSELEAAMERMKALESAAEQVQALEAAHAQDQERLRQLQSALDHERASKAAVSQPTQGQDEAESLRAEVDRMVSLFDASARAVTEMAHTRTSGELLTELVKRLSLYYSRVALFRLKGDRLEGEHQIGFEGLTDMSKLVIPTSVDSMLTRAVTSGAVESLYGDDVPVRSGTPFGGNPRSAVALPIDLQGTMLGVVYADDADMPESSMAIHESSVGFARLLAGQAIVLLVRHTHELKTLAELTQYASTLLQEAKEMYLADVQAGKSSDLVRRRLKENIDCASQLYAYRAAMEGTAAAALLDEQIAREIEDSTPFARDLAAVVDDMTGAEKSLISG